MLRSALAKQSTSMLCGANKCQVPPPNKPFSVSRRLSSSRHTYHRTSRRVDRHPLEVLVDTRKGPSGGSLIGKTREFTTTPPEVQKRMGNVLEINAGVAVGFAAGAMFAHIRPDKARAVYTSFCDSVAMPLIRLLDAERAHLVAVWAAAKGLAPKDWSMDDPILGTTVMGLRFSNPIGLAAGFDKHAEAVDGLMDTGFGFVEIGSVTPEPQEGNPKPRMFRLAEDEGVINRCGFNSHGVKAAYERLRDRQASPTPGRIGLVGINLGKNKTSEDASADYCKGIRTLGCYGDYLVVNVSSPNTPGLRALQRRGAIKEVIGAAMDARDKVLVSTSSKIPLPLLVKIAPDLSESEKEDIAAVALETEVDGLIVSNTTVARPSRLKSKNKKETGGLSGRPLRSIATATVRDMYRLTDGKVPLIGVGGVGTGKDAYEKIKAGASLVQVYSLLVYRGPGAVPSIKSELAMLLKADGFTCVAEAVGADHRKAVKSKETGGAGVASEGEKPRSRRWFFFW